MQRVMNLAHVLRQSARRFPDETALVWGERSWSWSALHRRACAAAAALAEAGVRKGDRVLLQARNGNALVESMFACFHLGAVWVPANFRLSPAEVAGLAETSGAVAMICGAEFPDHAAAVRAAVPGLHTVLAIGDAPFGPAWDAELVRYEGAEPPMADVTYDDPAWFFFTSGTTGRPKAGVLTHGQMAFVVTNHLCDLMPGTTEHDASLVVAPLSHGAGIHYLAQVARAAKSVLPAGARLDAEEAWALVERWRVTNMFTVPTILKLLAEHPAVHRYDHTTLRHVIYAGAPMYREDQRHALRTLGPVLVQYFGLGEVTGNITVLRPDLHDPADGPGMRPGTAGWERTGMQIAIQDEAGQERPPGETGEICVCGPAVFAGYFNNPDANAKAFRDGWFRTGDLGHMDAQGFLYITGRASDMYISGGSNVYPREAEELLLAHPAVAEAAVLGMPDRTWGEVGVAVCVLRPGAAADEAALLGWLEGKLARYKHPRRALLWDALPRSGYGKVTKALLKQEMQARGEWPAAGC